MGEKKSSSEKDDQKKFEKNNVTITLNVLDTNPTFVSKHNSNSEKQVIFLKFLNEEKWHYPAVKTLSALLRGITSKNEGYFYFIV